MYHASLHRAKRSLLGKVACLTAMHVDGSILQAIENFRFSLAKACTAWAKILPAVYTVYGTICRLKDTFKAVCLSAAAM